MRIALLVDPLTLRSRGGLHAPVLAQLLIERGHEVHGFGAPAGVVPQSVQYKEISGLSGYEADVLIAYDGLSPTAFSAARVARRSKARLILVEPGITREATPLHERVLQGIGERLWGTYVRNSTDHLVALDPVARTLALAEGFDEQRISVLPRGIDLERFEPLAGGSVHRRHGLRGRVVLYFGPLEASLGLRAMLRGFARTAGQHPDWSLVLVGSGAGLRRGLRSVTERQGVAANVHWIDEVGEEDLPGLFAAATLLVAPAADDRPDALPVLRALACGLPVLASDVERYRWAVADDERGLLVANEADWEAALGQATRAPAARERWARAARAWAVENLDWQTITDAFEQLFEGPSRLEPPEDSPLEPTAENGSPSGDKLHR